MRTRGDTRRLNEQDFPHLVELAVPPGGLGNQVVEIAALHRDLGIPVRAGRERREGEQFFVRYCFPNTKLADAFAARFAGQRLTYSSAEPARKP
jgi:hypothetical protein